MQYQEIYCFEHILNFFVGELFEFVQFTLPFMYVFFVWTRTQDFKGQGKASNIIYYMMTQMHI